MVDFNVFVGVVEGTALGFSDLVDASNVNDFVLVGETSALYFVFVLRGLEPASLLPSAGSLLLFGTGEVWEFSERDDFR